LLLLWHRQVLCSSCAVGVVISILQDLGLGRPQDQPWEVAHACEVRMPGLACRPVYPLWSCMTDGGTGTTGNGVSCFAKVVSGLCSLQQIETSAVPYLGSHGTVFGLAVFDACIQLCALMQLQSFFSMSPCQMLPSSPLLAAVLGFCPHTSNAWMRGCNVSSSACRQGLDCLHAAPCNVSIALHTVCLSLCMCYHMGRALLALCPCTCMPLAKPCVSTGVY